MNLINAVKTIYKELLIKDEPLKAYNLLKELDLPELEREKNISYKMVEHAFDEEIYQRNYGHHGEDQIPDAESIEPISFVDHPEKRYDRYGWIMGELKNTSPKSYMDLACYVGTLPLAAAKMGIKATGVDMTMRAVEMAKERNEKLGLNAEFFCDDITKFKGTTAELVSAFEVLEHVSDPKEFIKHLCDLSTGWVCVSTPNGPYGNGDGNLGGWNIPGYRGHLRVFTASSLRKLLEDCGCEIEFCEGMRDTLVWAKFRKKK